MSWLDLKTYHFLFIHLISMPYIKVPFRVVTRIIKDTSVGRSDWKYATSKWYLARSHTWDTSFTYVNGSSHTRDERSNKLYV